MTKPAADPVHTWDCFDCPGSEDADQETYWTRESAPVCDLCGRPLVRRPATDQADHDLPAPAGDQLELFSKGKGRKGNDTD